MSNEQQNERDVASLLSDMVSRYQGEAPPEPQPVASSGVPFDFHDDDGITFEVVEPPAWEASSAERQAVPDIPPLPEATAALTVPDLPVIETQTPAEPVPVAPAAVQHTMMSEAVTVVLDEHSEPPPVKAAETVVSAAVPAAAAVAAAAGGQQKVAVAPAKPQAAAPKAASKVEGLLRERAQLHPLLEKMAEESLKRNASDIFISSNFPPSFKIDGTLIPVPLKPLTEDEAAQIVYSTFNDEQKEAFPKELELNYSLQSKSGIRFRVNAYHEQGRIGLVMRRITTDILTIDDLQLPQSLKTLAMRKRGLIILAGATGSGKSTSQAAMLDWRNKHSAGHIVTIEDPIEYIHSPIKSIITQREVGLDTHSWGAAVQSAMRQAPDVVVVGEVRNEMSMEYALQLAQTGHLCFFTIHATNASQTVERIMNLYPEERHPQILMDLALNLVGIIGQRLVLKKGGKGRTAIVDLLINTPAMQDHIFKNQLMEARDLMERAEDDGMQTFDQDLFRLYINGEIDYDEALRQAESANDLRLRIKLYEEGRASEHIFERVGDLNLM